MAAAGVAYYALCVVENKKRDGKYGKQQDSVNIGLEADRSDQTDWGNHNFRYTY